MRKCFQFFLGFSAAIALYFLFGGRYESTVEIDPLPQDYPFGVITINHFTGHIKFHTYKHEPLGPLDCEILLPLNTNSNP